MGKQNAVLAKNRVDNLILPCSVWGIKSSVTQLSLINVEKFIDSNRKQLQTSQWAHSLFCMSFLKMAWNGFPHLEWLFINEK